MARSIQGAETDSLVNQMLRQGQRLTDFRMILLLDARQQAAGACGEAGHREDCLFERLLDLFVVQAKTRREIEPARADLEAMRLLRVRLHIALVLLLVWTVAAL